ncbi:MAG TPA: EAL domain-containing protein [Frankiaceae bacterium]|nr:EAL domain-containing protein [Frankiaceae bacterium]
MTSSLAVLGSARSGGDLSSGAFRRRLAVAAAAAALLLMLVALCLLTGIVGSRPVRWVDDLGELGFAAAASLATGLAARRVAGRRRAAWVALSVGTGGWAAGEVVWSVYELLADRQTPFPSGADIGYLVFPVAVTVGLWLMAASSSRGDRRRLLLDGVTVTCSLLLISSMTALGAVLHAGAGTSLGLVVGLAYPVGDVAVLTMTVLLLSRSVGNRLCLGLLGVGLVCMSMSDSAFAYLTAVGGYASGDPVDLGWFAAFALIALAGCAQRADAAGTTRTGAASADEQLPHSGTPAAVGIYLPYLPLLIAGAVLVRQLLAGRRLGVFDTLLAAALLLLVFVRQYSTLRDNRRLFLTVEAREQQLRFQAFHDTLTGLANRALFSDRLQHALELHRRDLRPVAVLLCDLDDFKVVNDTSGHAAGDELLTRVADRLRGAIRTGDTVARLGGDEFAVLLEDGGDPHQTGTRICDALREPFVLGDHPATISVSVGLAVANAADGTPTEDELLAHADAAMYDAKRDGKNQLRLFNPEHHSLSQHGPGLHEALARDIADGQLSTVYQPIIDTITGQVRGAEALARWTHKGQAIPPDVFIAEAEKHGLIGALTQLMLQRACADAAAWTSQTGRAVAVGVNIPPQLLLDPTLIDSVTQALSTHRLPAGQLVLEITESAPLTDFATAATTCRELRRIGVRLSLDDLGTGYSAMANLHHLPFTSVKIDRLFIDTIDDQPTPALVLGLLALANNLDVLVIAEGVERASQLEPLRAAGCHTVQGFLLARPAPAEALHHMIEHGHPLAQQANHKEPVEAG